MRDNICKRTSSLYKNVWERERDSKQTNEECCSIFICACVADFEHNII